MKRVLVLAGILLCLAASAWVYDNGAGYLREYFLRQRYPARASAASPLARAVEKDLYGLHAVRFNAQLRRIEAQVDAAERERRDIAGLRERLELARRLARQGRFDEARLFVNSVELRIPRPRQRLVAADENSIVPEAEIRGRAVKSRKNHR